MAEAFAFELKLVDSVSSAAKKATDAVAKLEKQATKTQEALNFSKDLNRVESSLKKLTADPKGYVALIKAQKELREQRNKLLEEAGLKKGESFFGTLDKKFGFAKLATAGAVGALMAEGALTVGEALLSAAEKVVDILKEGVTEAFKAAGHEEQLRQNYRLSFGKGGAGLLEDADLMARFSRFSSSTTAGMMRPLALAGLRGKALHQAFGTATDIAAGGGNMQSAIDMFTRIAGGGGISKKQLRDPSIGIVDVRGFYTRLGKALGISASEAEKRAGKMGGVDPQLLMNTITATVNARQGGRAGTGGQIDRNSFEGRMQRLKDLPENFFKRFVDSPGFKTVSDALGRLLDNLDPESPSGKRIMASLGRMFEKIVGWVDQFTSTDGIDNLTEGIETAVDALESAVSVATSLVNTLKEAAAIGMKLSHPIEAITNALSSSAGQTSADKEVAAAVDAFKSGKINADMLNAMSGNMTPSQRDDVKRALHLVVNNTVNVPAAEGGEDHTQQASGQRTRRHSTQHVHRAALGDGS